MSTYTYTSTYVLNVCAHKQLSVCLKIVWMLVSVSQFSIYMLCVCLSFHQPHTFGEARSACLSLCVGMHVIYP